nr:ABC transporter substrate-binding protein [bacterium]
MRKGATLFIAMAMMLALALAGCARPGPEATDALPGSPYPGQEGISFTDGEGTPVKLAGAPRRVAALMGSYAETWLLAGGQLIGVTEDVDDRGMELPDGVEIIGSVKSPNTERLIALRPDLALLSSDIPQHRAVAQTLQAANIPCAFFHVETFEDFDGMMQTCTDLTGRKDLYNRHVTLPRRRIADVLARVPDGKKPSVLLIRALSTKAKALPQDNMVSRMVDELGGDNIAARYPSLLDELSMEVILKENPDFILVVPMGSPDKAMEALQKSIEAHPAWASLSAVQQGHYVMLEQQLFHYKPNARWADSYMTLARLLYPDVYPE